MKKDQKPWDLLFDEDKRKCVQALIDFYSTERDEEIGVIAAEEILDSILQNAGLRIYNRGVKDATKVVQECFAGLEVDMSALLKEIDER